MPLPDAAAAHYRRQQQLAESTITDLAVIWATIDPANLTESWSSVADQAYVQLSIAQMAAAARADSYVDAVLVEQSIDAERTASITPRSFAGRAADGRSLETLLLEPIIAVKVAISNGQMIADAMDVGLVRLTRIAGTEVADAGRTAVGTAAVARPAATTWTRMLNPPSCSRCVVLAGKTFRWNQGFARHPLCDCVHIPTTENIAGDLTTDPRAYFDSLSAEDQAKYFTAAGADAINGGADVGQIVNARRKGGLYQANGQQYTTEGTTKRGFTGKTLPGVARPAPETIFENAADRADAIEQLRRFGYLV